MCAIPQLVSAPLNPIPIKEYFRRSHPQSEHSFESTQKARVRLYHALQTSLVLSISTYAR